MDSPPPAVPQREFRPQRELAAAWTLLVLHQRGETYGYDLHRELIARGVDRQATGVYRRLAKFERDRWVASRWADPVDGPQRHVYALTAHGRAALQEVTGSIAAARDAYDRFLVIHAQAVARRGAEGVDEHATPLVRAAPVPEASSAAPASQSSLRPHKWLLVGWLLLHLDAGPTYGYDLRRAFQAQRLSPDAGAMYRMLRRLEADGWVQSRWLRPAAGPRRRFYRLTVRGRRHLDEIAELIAVIGAAHETYLETYARVAEHP